MAEAEGITSVTMAAGRGGEAEPLNGLAALWTLGQPVDLAAINGTGRRTRIPAYPFHGPQWIAPEAVPPPVQEPDAAVAPPAPDSPRVLVTSGWADLLGYQDLADDTDFFAVGGDSLVLIRLVRRLGKDLDLTIPIREFAAARTLGDQIALVERLAAQEDDER
jgi:acyl carrier protein